MFSLTAYLFFLEGQFTVFAPNNAAFQKLPPGKLSDLLSNETALVCKYTVVCTQFKDISMGRLKISFFITADAYKLNGNYVSHSCRVELSENTFFQPFGNVSTKKKKRFTASIKVVLQVFVGQQELYLDKFHKLVFNCHVQRLRRKKLDIRCIVSNDILVYFMTIGSINFNQIAKLVT